MINSKATSEQEIKKRIVVARETCCKLERVWKAKEISIALKRRLAISLVWSVFLHGCESWTLRKEDERRITSFELWVWRRLLRVSWTERRTNEYIRKRVGVPEEKGLLITVKKRKIAKYGHWKRREKSLVLSTIEGEVEGKRKRGRRRTEWFDNIREWIDGGVAEARNIAEKRMPTAL